MKRRVIKQGNNTLTITLPRKWARKVNLQAGDEIELKEEDNSLRLLLENVPEQPRKIQLDFTDANKTVMNCLLAVVHKNGYDEVEVLYTDPSVVKVVQQRINSMLMGYEIVEQTNKRCIIRNVAGWHGGEFDNLLRRTFLVTLTLGKNSLEVIRSGKYEALQELLVLEETNNKLTNYCHSLLNRKIIDCPRKTTYLYIISWLLEKIGDEYRDLNQYLIGHSEVVLDKRILEAFEKANILLEEYYRLFYKYDLKKVEEIYQNHELLRKGLTHLMESRRKEELPVVVNLLHIVQKTHNCFGSTSCLNW